MIAHEVDVLESRLLPNTVARCRIHFACHCNCLGTHNPKISERTVIAVLEKQFCSKAYVGTSLTNQHRQQRLHRHWLARDWPRKVPFLS